MEPLKKMTLTEAQQRGYLPLNEALDYVKKTYGVTKKNTKLWYRRGELAETAWVSGVAKAAFDENSKTTIDVYKTKLDQDDIKEVKGIVSLKIDGLTLERAKLLGLLPLSQAITRIYTRYNISGYYVKTWLESKGPCTTCVDPHTKETVGVYNTIHKLPYRPRWSA